MPQIWKIQYATVNLSALFSPVFGNTPAVFKVGTDSQDDRLVVHSRAVQMAALCSAASEEFNSKIPKECHLSFCQCVIIELLPETIDILHPADSPLKAMANKGLIWLVETQIKSRRFDKYVGNTGDIVPINLCKSERMKKDRMICSAFAHWSFIRSDKKCMVLDL